MSSIRKTLKFCSFAQAVIAACVIAIAIIAAIGVKVPANAGIGDIVALWIDKVLYLILGGLGFWDAFMGIFGANRPSALGKHRLVAIIIVPFGIITGIILGGGRGDCNHSRNFLPYRLPGCDTRYKGTQRGRPLADASVASCVPRVTCTSYPHAKAAIADWRTRELATMAGISF